MAIQNRLTNNAARMALLLALAWPAAGQPPSPATRLAQFRAKGANAGITVFPVRLAGRAIPERRPLP